MSRALGLIIGYAADRLLGDPQRWHPVAGFGRAAAALERHTYADAAGGGRAHVAVLVGARPRSAGRRARRLDRDHGGRDLGGARAARRSTARERPSTELLAAGRSTRRGIG